jgi:hypothetical protein
MSHLRTHSYIDEATETLPPSTLFPPRPISDGGAGSDSRAAQLVEVPTKRAVWRIVLTVVAATTVLIALVVGSYMVYDAKTTEISQLKKQRQSLRATNGTLSNKLAIAATSLHTANVKLTKSTNAFTLTKKNLTRMRKDLLAANDRANANYDLGYSAGSSNGYSSGRDAGLIQGSDQLSCSDDPDVTWLPACNW